MRRPLIGLGAAGSVLALAACGGGGDSGGGTEAEGEMQAVTVGVIPIVDTAAIWLGEEQGFFEEEGLDVTVDVSAGGAAAVPGLMSGGLQLAGSNTVSALNRFPLQVIHQVSGRLCCQVRRGQDEQPLSRG